MFTDPAIQMVMDLEMSDPNDPWRVAVRDTGGEWGECDGYKALKNITSISGYWVDSSGYLTQLVHLDPVSSGEHIIPLKLEGGWNIVGVVYLGADQVGDDFGSTLYDQSRRPVTMADYITNYVRAYTWNAVEGWQVLQDNDPLIIGSGIQVFVPYGEDEPEGSSSDPPSLEECLSP